MTNNKRKFSKLITDVTQPFGSIRLNLSKLLRLFYLLLSLF